MKLLCLCKLIISGGVCFCRILLVFLTEFGLCMRFPASRGLSRRGKNERKDRLSFLPRRERPLLAGNACGWRPSPLKPRSTHPPPPPSPPQLKTYVPLAGHNLLYGSKKQISAHFAVLCRVENRV